MNRCPRWRPAAMPRSADFASPGPFTTHPMTATWIGSSRSPNAALARVATSKRELDSLRQHAVRLDHERHDRRLDRDLHVVEADLGEVRELALRRCDERFRRDAVALLDVGIERAGVDTDADRHAAVLRLL